MPGAHDMNQSQGVVGLSAYCLPVGYQRAVHDPREGSQYKILVVPTGEDASKGCFNGEQRASRPLAQRREPRHRLGK